MLESFKEFISFAKRSKISHRGKKDLLLGLASNLLLIVKIDAEEPIVLIASVSSVCEMSCGIYMLSPARVSRPTEEIRKWTLPKDGESSSKQMGKIRLQNETLSGTLQRHKVPEVYESIGMLWSRPL